MAVSNSCTRRSRYRPDPASAPSVLSPVAVLILECIAEFAQLTSQDLLRLTGLSKKVVVRELRRLFDSGLVTLVIAPRDALALPGSAARVPVLGGSSPNLYEISRAGARLLDLGPADAASVRRRPHTSLFLAHSRFVTQIRVWLAWSARVDEQTLIDWREGGAAEIPLSGGLLLRPDAWFSFRLATGVLVGLVEADCGTERGATRWRQKLAKYRELYASERLRALTGYQHARVLVVTPDLRRRERLATLIAANAPAWFAERFWVADRSVLDTPGLAASLWQQAGASAPAPLLAGARVSKEGR